MTNIDEIVNKAIPLSFNGVKCAATLLQETEKAKIRRENLKREILSLLENQTNAGNNVQPRMEGSNTY